MSKQIRLDPLTHLIFFQPLIFDKYLEHAMLINMHENFTGRVIFALLHTLSILPQLHVSTPPYCPDESTTVNLNKGQLEEVEHITNVQDNS